MKIAILHPQCRIQGGAIKMALLSTHLLTDAGHDTALYTLSHSSDCFADLQKNIKIELHEPAKNIPFSPLKKLISIITLAWRLRHVDTIVANNPPMQIVAALAKIFSLKFKVQSSKFKVEDYKNKKFHHFSFFIFHFSLSTLSTIWWHHHTPWYIYNNRIKSFFERYIIIPYIDTMIVTSHFVGEQLKTYSGRDATVIHPVLPVIPESFVPSSSKESNTGLDSRLRGNDGDRDDGKVLLFTHGRLESGKGIETVISVWKSLEADRETQGKTRLIIYGTGSLEQSLRAQGIDVQPYDVESTLRDIATSGMSSLAIYASTIDAFGMAPLEAQSTGISTLILDRGGARETLVSDVSGECVGRLVDSEEELYSTVSYFITHKKFPKNMSIVNFCHTIDYFTPQRLSSDLLSVINKTRE